MTKLRYLSIIINIRSLGKKEAVQSLLQDGLSWRNGAVLVFSGAGVGGTATDLGQRKPAWEHAIMLEVGMENFGSYGFNRYFQNKKRVGGW